MQCHVDVHRTVEIACFDASSLLVNQIKEWTTESCPPKSQKCLYSVSNYTDIHIQKVSENERSYCNRYCTNVSLQSNYISRQLAYKLFNFSVVAGVCDW